jgi:competence protein ComGC
VKKGFTLIEMVVVVAVIGGLLLLTIPNVTRVLNTLLEKGCDAQLKVIDTAIIEYRLMFDEEATSIEELVDRELISDAQTQCNGKTITLNDGKATTE